MQSDVKRTWRLTHAQKHEILRLWDERKQSSREIGELFGVSSQRVCYLAKQWGRPSRKGTARVWSDEARDRLRTSNRARYLDR